MELKERREFYEKNYFHELDVREKIESRLKLPMTIFAIVFAMNLFLVNEILVKKTFIPEEFFLVLFVSSNILLFCAVYFFIKSWYGYTYKMMPHSMDIDNYFDEIVEHYRKSSEENYKSWTYEAFEEYLLSKFRDYGSYNTMNNDRKVFNIHRCITSLLMAFFLSVISYLPYYISIHQQV